MSDLFPLLFDHTLSRSRADLALAGRAVDGGRMISAATQEMEECPAPATPFAGADVPIGRPQVPATVRRSSVGRTRGTISARGRQHAGESPFDSVRRMERHPPSGHHERGFSRTLVLERVFGSFLRAQKGTRPQAKQQYRPQGRGIPAEEGPAPAVTPAGPSDPEDSLWSHHNNRPS